MANPSLQVSRSPGLGPSSVTLPLSTDADVPEQLSSTTQLLPYHHLVTIYPQRAPNPHLSSPLLSSIPSSFSSPHSISLRFTSLAQRPSHLPTPVADQPQETTSFHFSYGVRVYDSSLVRTSINGINLIFVVTVSSSRYHWATASGVQSTTSRLPSSLASIAAVLHGDVVEPASHSNLFQILCPRSTLPAFESAELCSYRR